jgi:ATP-dependent DNA helicase DinG
MAADATTQLARTFAPDGPLARVLEGYRARPQQLEFARSVAGTLANGGVLVAEAGTGTGKTVAYLVPALLCGGKVIVSTGTKTLQDQLYDRDLPRVRAALGVPVSVALLKGRSNYVCHYHLGRAQSDGRFATRDDARHLRAIVRFARTSTTGDRADLPAVPETAGVWSQVTSTRDNCLGSECPHFDDCFVMKARREALAADLVVVNHHLFFADLALRDTGVAELLPAANSVIFDEAHQLPDVATQFFGESLSSAQLLELGRDTLAETLAGAPEARELRDAIGRLDKAARDLRLAFPADAGRIALREVQANAAFAPALEALAARLAELTARLEPQAERTEGLGNCLARCADLAACLERWRRAVAAGAAGDATDEVAGRDAAIRPSGGADEGAAGPEAAVPVLWVELTAHAAILHATPLSIAPYMRRQIAASPKGWVFASATLSIGGDFSHYLAEMGLDGAHTASWPSPFDFARNARLYCPRDLPEPNAAGYTAAVAAAALPAIRAAGGRAFVLCTSLRAMREVHEHIRAAFERDGLDLPLLLQGSGSRTELLERFRRLGNAVLVASQSFWEGVDVRGSALSLVIIDRLPFAVPDDPVVAARIEHLTRSGRNAFMEYQVPAAAIALKQGAGRLIRDEHDRGVLMICDPRLATRPYARRILASLPPMKRTRELAEIERFFDESPMAGVPAPGPGRPVAPAPEAAR